MVLLASVVRSLLFGLVVYSAPSEGAQLEEGGMVAVVVVQQKEVVEEKIKG